jgi:hypothetical protein
MEVQYEGQLVNRLHFYIRRKHVIFWTAKTFISRHIHHQNSYTRPIALPVRRNPQHRSILTVVSATSVPPFQPLRHQRNICQQDGFLADQTDGSQQAPSPGCKSVVQEIRIAVLKLSLSPGLLGLYRVWYCYEGVHLLPVGLEVFYEFHPETSRELHSTVQNSHFHR